MFLKMQQAMKDIQMNRDYAIDALRVIALFCIVLAHVSPNQILFDLRNFDVVCMVVIMGMSYNMSSQKTEKKGYFSYILKRVKRLLIPTWLFLAVFFIVFNFLSKFNNNIVFDFKTYKTSFLLIDGIGYVWIIKVYLLIALISPGIKYISQSVKNNISYTLFLVLWYFSYQFFLLKTNEYQSCFKIINTITDGNFYVDVWLYLLGFGFIAALGYKYKEFSKWTRYGIILVSFLCYIGFIIKNGYISTQQYKYPPQTYYISYGLLVTLILYELLSIKKISKLLNNKLIAWISKNSLWIYLWHIVGVRILAYYKLYDIIETRLFPRWLFCIIVAIMLTLIQNYIKQKFKQLVRCKK